MPEWNHHQKTQSNDTLTDQHACSLPRTKVGNLREGMRPHAKDVRQPGKNGEDKPSCNEAAAHVGDDRPFLDPPPERVQSHIAADADPRQPDQKDDDLNEADHGAAVPAEKIGLGANRKDEQPDERENQTQPNAWSS